VGREFSPEGGEETILRTTPGTENGASRPVFSSDLLASERAFVAAMRQMHFGRFERLRIVQGELVLTPWPATVRDVKFCAKDDRAETPDGEFLLQPQVAELFEYVRDVDAGEVRELQVRHGLPFAMEIELAGAKSRAPEGGRRG
jgi:hypothetical protein